MPVDDFEQSSMMRNIRLMREERDRKRDRQLARDKNAALCKERKIASGFVGRRELRSKVTKDWSNILPENIAEKQRDFDLEALILRLLDAGLRQNAIARRLNTSIGVIHELAKRARKNIGKPSPIEVYFSLPFVVNAVKRAASQPEQQWPSAESAG